MGNGSTLRALTFDVFGTLVDWRTSVAREARNILSPLGISLDWPAFADAWRRQYQPSMEEVRSGRVAFRTLDALHRSSLDIVLASFGLSSIGEPTKDELTLVWHRLDAWPDVKVGLAKLHRLFRVAPCSNGNISLMVDLARHNGFVWDAILGAEIARDYKPKSSVYLSSVVALGCTASQVMMVAAHSSDLAAAASVGMRTAFIPRPEEHGPGASETRASIPVDVSADDLPDLADKLQGA